MSDQQELILTKGLPASGKSTWAKAMIETNPAKYVRVNKDDIRSEMGVKYSAKTEEIVLAKRDAQIANHLNQGKTVINDDTNLNPKHEAHLRELFAGVKVTIKDFRDVDVDICIERDKNRIEQVGEKAIRDMYDRYIAKVSGQRTLFSIKDAKERIADSRKEYLSKLITKKQKFAYQIIKKRPKYILKSTNDMPQIMEVIKALETGDHVHLWSNAFDSPSIIFAINKAEKVLEVVCSTWAITDRGLMMFQEVGEGVDCYLLLDKTYSYKWVFESGAIAYLKNVKMKFSENHSKVILIRTEKNFYSFVGSMNLSNNPRIENIIINNNQEIYEFYERQIKKEFE